MQHGAPCSAVQQRQLLDTSVLGFFKCNRTTLGGDKSANAGLGLRSINTQKGPGTATAVHMAVSQMCSELNDRWTTQPRALGRNPLSPWDKSLQNTTNMTDCGTDLMNTGLKSQHLQTKMFPITTSHLCAYMSNRKGEDNRYLCVILAKIWCGSLGKGLLP